MMDARDDRSTWIQEQALDALIAMARGYGVTVEFTPPPTQGYRYLGRFRGARMVLYDTGGPAFDRWFTVAHLFGHMQQWTRPDPRMARSNRLIYQRGEEAEPVVRPLSEEEVQCVFDYEREAAAIGRHLVARTGPIPPSLDAEYTRFFLADFRYLVNYIETSASGPALFEDHLRHEPRPYGIIAPDERPLVDLAGVKLPEFEVAVV